MKLLLTSSGITTNNIAAELKRLTGKNPDETKIGFISTASNVEPGNKVNKFWFVKQFFTLKEHGYLWIDVIDIAAPQVDWRSRLAVVDVIMVGGGNTFYLLKHVREQGFDQWLQSNIEEKIYVGISAGSILITPSIAVAGIEPGDENVTDITEFSGVGLTDFEVSPHAPELVSYEANEAYALTISRPLHCIDETTALSIENEKVSVIGHGHQLFT